MSSRCSSELQYPLHSINFILWLGNCWLFTALLHSKTCLFLCVPSMPVIKVHLLPWSLSLSSSLSIFCISIFHETQLQPPAVPHKGRNHPRYRCTHCFEIRGRLFMSSLHTSETVEEGRANGRTTVILWHWTSHLYNNLS